MDMSAQLPQAWPVVALMLGAPAATIALGVLVVRHVRRTGRDAGRLQSGELYRLLSARLDGRLQPAEVRRAAAGVSHDAFWDAIGALALTLRMRERRALARTLEGSRHVARERRRLLASLPVMRRERAAYRLGLLPSPRTRRLLRRAMVQGPDLVSFAAARALARHRDLRSLRWLLEQPASVTRQPIALLSGLLRAFGPRGRALLITALERGLADPRMVCACVDALGMTRCRSARGSIEARLASPHLEVRVAAARALGRLGMPEAIPALMPLLADDRWPVRAMTAQALGRLSASPAVDALAIVVTDSSWWVRHHAAYALAAIGGDGHDALCAIAARSPDRYAREMAREALDHGQARRRA
ncbi:MAG: hypothetical protein RL760_462 [Candidatus Eisenbacteria bacterium]